MPMLDLLSLTLESTENFNIINRMHRILIASLVASWSPWTTQTGAEFFVLFIFSHLHFLALRKCCSRSEMVWQQTLCI